MVLEFVRLANAALVSSDDALRPVATPTQRRGLIQMNEGDRLCFFSRMAHVVQYATEGD